MATNSASLSSKRRTGHRDDCKDRISRLPDEVLSHILSFLPTKYAVLTSILSNRWRSIWTSVPNLDFNDDLLFNRGSPSPEICFRKFVTRVLSLRNNTSSSIHTFRLECRNTYHPSHFNNWISSAIANGVRELDLRYDSVSDNTVDLPRSLLCWEKLEVLKLRSNFRIQFPEYTICLHSLVVLHLIWVQFDNGSTVEKLISSCPLLEEFEIDREFHDSLDHLVINSRSLKRLKIVADLVDGPSKVIVNTPSLEFVDLLHNLSGSYDMKSELSLLVKAKIDVMLFDSNDYEPSDQQYDPSYQQNLGELLRAISNVRFLAVSENFLNAVKFPFNLYESHPQLCPHKCSMSYLEKIELEGFVGGPSEMELVSYFLKNATVLEKMAIRYRFSKSDKDVSQIVKKLLMFPRGSTTSVSIHTMNQQIMDGWRGFSFLVRSQNGSLKKVVNCSYLNDCISINLEAHLITLPKFWNLIRLEVKIGRHGWLVLPKLLKCLPNLKYFVFQNCKAYKSSTHDMPNYEPRCLSMLQMMEIIEFEGCQKEMKFVRYILESAMVLKKMSIYSSKMHLEEESTVRKRLTGFPRASKSCELVFY